MAEQKRRLSLHRESLEEFCNQRLEIKQALSKSPGLSSPDNLECVQDGLTLSPTQHEAFRGLFDQLDAEKSGKISLFDLEEFVLNSESTDDHISQFCEFLWTQPSLHGVFLELDVSQTGFLTWKEFLPFVIEALAVKVPGSPEEKEPDSGPFYSASQRQILSPNLVPFEEGSAVITAEGQAALQEIATLTLSLRATLRIDCCLEGEGSVESELATARALAVRQFFSSAACGMPSSALLSRGILMHPDDGCGLLQFHVLRLRSRAYLPVLAPVKQLFSSLFNAISGSEEGDNSVTVDAAAFEDFLDSTDEATADAALLKFCSKIQPKIPNPNQLLSLYSTRGGSTLGRQEFLLMMVDNCCVEAARVLGFSTGDPQADLEEAQGLALGASPADPQIAALLGRFSMLSPNSAQPGAAFAF